MKYNKIKIFLLYWYIKTASPLSYINYFNLSDYNKNIDCISKIEQYNEINQQSIIMSPEKKQLINCENFINNTNIDNLSESDTQTVINDSVGKSDLDNVYTSVDDHNKNIRIYNSIFDDMLHSFDMRNMDINNTKLYDESVNVFMIDYLGMFSTFYNNNKYIFNCEIAYINKIMDHICFDKKYKYIGHMIISLLYIDKYIIIEDDIKILILIILKKIIDKTTVSEFVKLFNNIYYLIFVCYKLSYNLLNDEFDTYDEMFFRFKKNRFSCSLAIKYENHILDIINFEFNLNGVYFNDIIDKIVAPSI